MLVALFTDASMSVRLQRGTWAAWAKADGATLRVSGILGPPVEQIGTAELAAVANGLSAVKARFAPGRASRVIVQTDCQEAITALRTGRHPREADATVIRFALGLARAEGWSLDLRHVKGHRGTATPRNAVNTWCDRECRRQMGLLMRELEDA